MLYFVIRSYNNAAEIHLFRISDVLITYAEFYAVLQK